MTPVSEATVETAALDWLHSLGWAIGHGLDVAPDTVAAERAGYGEVVLSGRLRSALASLNPDLPDDALEDALQRLIRPTGPTMASQWSTSTPTGGFGASRFGCSISTYRAATTGWRSTSSQSSRTSANGGRTSFCSSTGCRWASSS